MNVAPLVTSSGTSLDLSSDTSSRALAAKVARLRMLLQRIERDHSPAAFASRVGAEDMILDAGESAKESEHE